MDPSPRLHLDRAQLDAALDHIRASPADHGRLELIVRRPAKREREVLAQGRLDRQEGLVGDSWRLRPSSRTEDGSPHPDMQLTLMNSRVVQLIAGTRERWPLAGDQLYVDMDLSQHNLPAGSRLTIGSAIIEVTGMPHTGCKKFVERFGADAMKWVNSKLGRELNLRGINAKVIESGDITTGDALHISNRTRA